MKSNLSWKTDYFVRVKDCLVGVSFTNDLNQTYWSAYIKASDEEVFQLLFDGLTKAEIRAKPSELERLKIEVIIDSSNEDGYLGGYLPEQYENLLDKLRVLVYELIENFMRTKGEKEDG